LQYTIFAREVLNLKQTRKWTALFVAALMLILTACGGGGSSKNESASSNKSSGATGNNSSQGSSSQQEQVTLRVAWWGNESRAKIYNEIFDLYEQLNPHVKIVRETANYNDYYTKLAAQFAGGNPPDLLGMHMLNYGGDYVARGVLEPLDPYIESGAIDTTDWDQAILDSGRVDGTMYGISKGVTFTSIVVNKRMLAEAGMTLPDHTMNYEEFAQFMSELQTKLPKGVYATTDGVQWEHAIDTWVRQKGKNLMSPDGSQIGFTKDDLREFYQYWYDLTQTGAVTPASITAEYKNQPQENSTLVKGITATLITNLNQAKIYTNYMDDELDVIRWPLMADGVYKGGENLQSSAWSIAKSSKNKEEAVKLLNWFVNDIEAGKIFKAELGIPGNLKVQEALKDILHPLDVKGFELQAEAAKDAPPVMVRAPGSPQLIQTVYSYGEQIAFGRMSVDEAVEGAFAEFERILQAR
jgi:multiple sugar transport system substrate-binding protein